MTVIRDTTDVFETYARSVFLESPVVREQRWDTEYEPALADVFEAFYARLPERAGRAALVREISLVRDRVPAAVPNVIKAIETVEPKVRELLGAPAGTEPQHVLMVGPYGTNAIVGRMGSAVTVFHCLEWFHPMQATKVLVAHEDAHAWHEILLGAPTPEDDPMAMAFSEGLAVQASRGAVPGQPENDYFWYGHEGFETWLPWCTENHDDLRSRFRADSIGEVGKDAAEKWFGSGLVDGHWRAGYFVADRLVADLDRPLHELAAMTIDEGADAIRSLLG